MQASGHRFDPDKLHQTSAAQRHSRDEESGFAGLPADMRRVASLFDIVNGFFNRCRGDMVRFREVFGLQENERCCTQNDYLAELNHHTEYKLMQCFSSAVIGGVDSQA